MNKIFLLTLVSAFVFVGCKQSNQMWSMKLPAHFNTRNPQELEALLPDSVKGHVVTQALLFEENEMKVILRIPLPVYEGYPSVVTFDKDGGQIDEFVIFQFPEDTNGEDLISDVSILPDRTIVAVDSLFANSAVFNDNMEVDHEVRSVSVTQRKFRITASGKIEKISEAGL
jgi:hypothetical protein